MATGSADRPDLTGGTDARDLRGAGLTTQYIVNRAPVAVRSHVRNGKAIRAHVRVVKRKRRKS